MGKKIALGLLAHVDAGKTTLAEAMIYKFGSIRTPGRVDNGDTFLDNHELERARGITIFSGMARLNINYTELTLIDTPGHVDFSAEAERTLQILDAAVLVISATDGVQAHSITLFNLLKRYSIPTFIFVTKTDFHRRTNDDILTELQEEFGEGCIDFNNDHLSQTQMEQLAVLSEKALNEYLTDGIVREKTIAELVSNRECFPCFYGSGLKAEGIDELLSAIDRLIPEKSYGDSFGARVFKVTRDKNGARVVHIKITGGKLCVKDSIKYDDSEEPEKINQIRIYDGSSYKTTDIAEAGCICAVTGLNKAKIGTGLGSESNVTEPFIEPVMTYRIILPDNTDTKSFLPKIKQLEDEDPLLRVRTDTAIDEIDVELMGTVQAEILKSVVSSRFGIDIEVDRGRVLYKETIREKVEGIGHYEPLRHYAEVHLIIEPAERGHGIKAISELSEDSLDRNWQRLILMHIYEKQHLGVLTGSPLTDVKIKLVAGRAHIKHTEGGDFRQATYRAIRQGLMQAESVLLEPYYAFKLDIPHEQTGRAISDLQAMHAKFSPPVTGERATTVCGTAPVTTMNDYAASVAAYTSGLGRLSLNYSGYDVCHNAAEIIEAYDYDPEADLDNTPDSVFCANGGGFNVKWNKVHDYMHIESCLKQKTTQSEPQINKRNFHLDDKELEEIMRKEFGPAGQTVLYRKPEAKSEPDDGFELRERKKCIILDGYNCIFAWDKLKSISEVSLDAAREQLIHITANFSAFTHCEAIIVFDAYLVNGGKGSKYEKSGVQIVFTRENETADAYIERFISEIGSNYNVTVVTSDNLIRLASARFGVLRLSAQGFEEEVKKVGLKIDEIIQRRDL